MEKINIYIIEINSKTNTSGVDRYIGNLIEGLSSQPFVRLYRIQLTQTSSIFSYRELVHSDYTEITIPTPQDLSEIVKEKYWNHKYNLQVFSLIRHLFTKQAKNIIHLHTLNLIDLALYIKEQFNCKIITHLHCIPWKSYYNTDKKKFNFLYYQCEVLNEKANPIDQLITHYNEYLSYSLPDKIICVTHNAKKFLRETLQIPAKIVVIPNGIKDHRENSFIRENKKRTDLFKILFVGNATESKGILFILEALRRVRSKGYNVDFTIAGSCDPSMKQIIKQEYRELSVHILGVIPFEELMEYYKKSDIGVIASLQEQCSYAALEMAMFGLPVVTTAIDGLDEIFQDQVNALKVNTAFSRVLGLRVDTQMFSEKIIALIENEVLRKQIGENARSLYEKKYSLERMIGETTEVYKKLTYE